MWGRLVTSLGVECCAVIIVGEACAEHEQAREEHDSCLRTDLGGSNRRINSRIVSTYWNLSLGLTGSQAFYVCW